MESAPLSNTTLQTGSLRNWLQTNQSKIFFISFYIKLTEKVFFAVKIRFRRRKIGKNQAHGLFVGFDFFCLLELAGVCWNWQASARIRRRLLDWQVSARIGRRLLELAGDSTCFRNMFCSFSLALKEGEWGVKLSLKRGFVSILLLRCWSYMFLRVRKTFLKTSPFPRETTVFSVNGLENACQAKPTLNVVIAGASLYEPRVLGSTCFSVSGFFSFILIGPFNNNTFRNLN